MSFTKVHDHSRPAKIFPDTGVYASAIGLARVSHHRRAIDYGPADLLFQQIEQAVQLVLRAIEVDGESAPLIVPRYRADVCTCVTHGGVEVRRLDARREQMLVFDRPGSHCDDLKRLRLILLLPHVESLVAFHIRKHAPDFDVVLKQDLL